MQCTAILKPQFHHSKPLLRVAALPRLSTQNTLPYRQWRYSMKAFASSEETSEPPSSDAAPQPQPTSSPSAVAIPAGLRTAGAVFVLAGFLKILIVCFPYSTMAISMFLQGRADLGTWAAIKMLPIALGLLALAKSVVDRGIHESKWFHRAVVVGSIAALVLSRWAFARPRPSPLDPLIAAHQRQAAVSSLEAQKQERADMLRREQGRRLEPSEEARKILEERNARGDRFAIKNGKK